MIFEDNENISKLKIHVLFLQMGEALFPYKSHQGFVRVHS